MKASNIKLILLSFAEQIKNVSTAGGALFALFAGSSFSATEEKTTLIMLTIAWWFLLQVVAHLIMAFAMANEEIEEDEETDK